MRLYDKNMIEMRDGRKPVISPQLKSVSNYIDISLDDIREACEAAFKKKKKKNDVVNFNSDFDGNSLKLYEWYLDGTYVSKIKYRKLVKENKNGKVREINSPDLTTRIYQHLVLVNYEIRSNNKNEPNWIKCLIGIPETNKEGIPTGRKLAREFHGNYQGIVNFISKCELTYGKDAILPITDVEIENRCGYVFKGSTNRLEYID